MAYPIVQKEKVIDLRKHGESIRDISKNTGLPKSTVSYWCRDIQLTKTQLENLQDKCKKAGSAKCLEIAEKKRATRMSKTHSLMKKGARSVGYISKRDISMLGLGLYWGEGYKKSCHELGFTNSDQAIIGLYLLWLKTVYNIDKECLTLRVSINESHKDREKKILNYWSHFTKIQLSQFTKTSFIKSTSKKVYPNRETHFGTLRIKVQKSSTLLHQTLGALKHIGKITE